LPPWRAGIDFKIKTIELEGKRIKLQIWSVFTNTILFTFIYVLADPEAIA
jgi:hypothetical protein